MSTSGDSVIEFPKVTVERRWQAARRLAAGDSVVLAAARAGLHEDQVKRMLAEDEGFVALRADAERLLQGEARVRRQALADMAFEALDDALMARNASIINNALKTLGHFQDCAEEGDQQSETISAEARFLASLTNEELAEYLWIGARSAVPVAVRADMPYVPPEGLADRIQALAEDGAQGFEKKPAAD